MMRETGVCVAVRPSGFKLGSIVLHPVSALRVAVHIGAARKGLKTMFRPYGILALKESWFLQQQGESYVASLASDGLYMLHAYWKRHASKDCRRRLSSLPPPPPPPSDA